MTTSSGTDSPITPPTNPTTINMLNTVSDDTTAHQPDPSSPSPTPSSQSADITSDQQSTDSTEHTTLGYIEYSNPILYQCPYFKIVYGTIDTRILQQENKDAFNILCGIYGNSENIDMNESIENGDDSSDESILDRLPARFDILCKYVSLQPYMNGIEQPIVDSTADSYRGIYMNDMELFHRIQKSCTNKDILIGPILTDMNSRLSQYITIIYPALNRDTTHTVGHYVKHQQCRIYTRQQTMDTVNSPSRQLTRALQQYGTKFSIAQLQAELEQAQEEQQRGMELQLSLYDTIQRCELLLDIAISICHTLEQIHSANYTYNRLSSACTMYDIQSKKCILLQYGWAKALSNLSHNTIDDRILMTNMHTLPYISPELTGRLNCPIDQRTDLYSLGCLLYELSCGMTPYETIDTDSRWVSDADACAVLIHAHLARAPPPLYSATITDAPDIHPVHDVIRLLHEIIFKLIEKEPDNRYNTVAGLLHDIQYCRVKLHERPSISSLSPSTRESAATQLTGKLREPAQQFVIGQADAYATFRLSTKRYGRQHEYQLLMSAYNRVMSSQPTRPCLVVVLGYSGIGKTSLINELQKPVLKHRGFFVTCKFTSQQHDSSVIISALNILITQILAESTEIVDAWKTELNCKLDAYAQYLVDLIPSLNKLINCKSLYQTNLHKDSTSVNRAVVKLLSAFSTYKHPVVLFIDDIQYCDIHALQLIKTLFEQHDICLLIVCAANSNECDETHPVRTFVQNCERYSQEQKGQDWYIRINLPELTYTEVNQLLRDTFHQTATDVAELANLLYHKAFGLPLIINQLLLSYYNNKTIHYDLVQQQWIFDMDTIKREVMTGGLLELLKTQISQLDNNAQDILRHGGLIGYTFPLCLLYLATGKRVEDVCKHCITCIENGLLNTKRVMYERMVECSERDDTKPLEYVINEYVHLTLVFTHDRVYEAAIELTPVEQRAAEHLIIARLMLQYRSKFVYSAVDVARQFDSTIELIDDPIEAEAVININMEGSDMLKKSASHQSTLQMLKRAVQLLDVLGKQNQLWKSKYDLMYRFYSRYADELYYNSNLDNANMIVELLLQHVNNPLHRAETAYLQYIIMSQCASFAEIREHVIDTLKSFDMELKKLTLDIPINELINNLDELQSVTDTRIEVIYKLLRAMLISVFSNTYIDVFKQLTVTSMRLVLKYGKNIDTPFIILNYSVALAAKHRYKDSVTVSNYAMNIFNKNKTSMETLLPRMYLIYYSQISHWVQPALRDSIDQLLHAIHVGMSVSDLDAVGFLAYVLCSHYFLAQNIPLKLVYKYMSLFLDALERRHMVFKGYVVFCYKRLVEKLLCIAPDTFELFGETFTESEFVTKISVMNKYIGATYYMTVSVVASYSHKYIRTVCTAVAAEPQLEGGIGSYLNTYTRFLIVKNKFAACERIPVETLRFCNVDNVSDLVNETYQYNPNIIAHPNSDQHDNITTLYNDIHSTLQLLQEYISDENTISPVFYFMCALKYDLLATMLGEMRLVPTACELYEKAIQRAADLQMCSYYAISCEFYANLKIYLHQYNDVDRLIAHAYAAERMWGNAKHCMVLQAQYTDTLKRTQIPDLKFLKRKHRKKPVISTVSAALQFADVDLSQPSPELINRQLIDVKNTAGIDIGGVSDTSSDTDIPVTPQTTQQVPKEDTHKQVDFALLMRASQKFATEKSIDALLSKLMRIVLQHSNASNGVLLLLSTNGPLTTTANITNPRYIVTCSIDVDVNDERDGHIRMYSADTAPPVNQFIPQTVFNIVTRTSDVYQTHLCNNYTDTNPIVAADPFFHTHTAKAILCSPITLQEQIIGILYLENRYSCESFGTAHVQVLLLLSSQAAASIDNARLHTSLENAKIQAEQAAQSKANFLSNMSHELRTPLNAVLGVSTILQSTALDVEQAQCVDMIVNSGHLLLSIINDILTFTKLESDTIEFDNAPYSIYDTVETACHMVYPNALSKNIDFGYVVDPRIPNYIFGDSNREMQLILNLLSNAVKFTTTGGVLYELKLMDTDATSTTASILYHICHDTGIGMSDEIKNKLFQPFTQGDTSVSRRFGGTGLGLSIVKKIAEVRGGGVDILSEPGVGSVFTVTVHTEPFTLYDTPSTCMFNMDISSTYIVSAGFATQAMIQNMCQWDGLMKTHIYKDINECKQVLSQAKYADKQIILLIIDTSCYDTNILRDVYDEIKLHELVQYSNEYDVYYRVLVIHKILSTQSPQLTPTDVVILPYNVHVKHLRKPFTRSKFTSCLLSLMSAEPDESDIVRTPSSTTSQTAGSITPLVLSPILRPRTISQSSTVPTSSTITTPLTTSTEPSPFMLHRRLSVTSTSSLSTTISPSARTTSKLRRIDTLNEQYPLSIMLVEDNVVNQKMMNMTLKKLGYNIKIVSNGTDALNNIIEHTDKYDLILMDVNMDGMSGLDCTQHIRTHEQQCLDQCRHYIIGQTADVNARDACIRAGLDYFLAKPIAIEQLTQAIKDAYTYINQ